MGIGSGLGSSLGIAPEDTYGAYKAPTRFLEYDGGAKLKKIKNTAQGKGLAGGRHVPLASRRVVTSKAAGGSLSLEVPNKGFGLVLNGLLGGAAAPVKQAATAAYLQTHALSATQDNAGKFFTMQAAVPSTDGVANAYTFLGSKLTSMEFTCGVDELLMCAIDVDCRDVVESEVLVAPAPLAGVRPFHFGQSTVKIGATAGAAAKVDGVRKMTLKLGRPMDTGRFYHGAGGLKAEPLLNGLTDLSGTVEYDLVNKGDFADRYAADEQFALIWEFVGPVIADTYAEMFRITAPACFLDDGAPQVDGPDVVKGSAPFVVLNDGSAPPVTIEYMSTDLTL